MCNIIYFVHFTKCPSICFVSLLNLFSSSIFLHEFLFLLFHLARNILCCRMQKAVLCLYTTRKEEEENELSMRRVLIVNVLLRGKNIPRTCPRFFFLFRSLYKISSELECSKTDSDQWHAVNAFFENYIIFFRRKRSNILNAKWIMNEGRECFAYLRSKNDCSFW